MPRHWLNLWWHSSISLNELTFSRKCPIKLSRYFFQKLCTVHSPLWCWGLYIPLENVNPGMEADVLVPWFARSSAAMVLTPSILQHDIWTIALYCKVLLPLQWWRLQLCIDVSLKEFTIRRDNDTCWLKKKTIHQLYTHKNRSTYFPTTEKFRQNRDQKGPWNLTKVLEKSW